MLWKYNNCRGNLIPDKLHHDGDYDDEDVYNNNKIIKK